MDYKLFLDYLKGKKVAFIGIGVSHFNLIGFLLKKSIDVSVLDRREKEEIGLECDTLSALGAKFVCGKKYLDNLTDYDIVFRTPGMYYFSEKLQKARESGVIITSEMEVFFKLCPCKIYAVTGSDGKTTTTTLIGELLKASGKTVHVGGNIGRALLPHIADIKEDHACVVELSSFQLISMSCAPDVSVITNISPNHLDVHKDMEEYIESKKNIFIHQDGFSRTVLNLDNEETAKFIGEVRGRVSTFSRKSESYTGTFVDREGYICKSEQGVSHRVIKADEIFLPGAHNVENYLAAISAVSDDDVTDQMILTVAKNFGGVEHRIEYVRTIDGVQYYNNSIATSPTRTIAELNSFEKKKMIIIAGGYDKNIAYEPLAPALCDRAKCLILLGATANKIEKATRECEKFKDSGLEIIRVDTLEEAVKAAKEVAVKGDIVSLSPASASFDLYKNFEQRGLHYKKIVNSL